MLDKNLGGGIQENLPGQKKGGNLHSIVKNVESKPPLLTTWEGGFRRTFRGNK
jgi:hypothetical protein